MSDVRIELCARPPPSEGGRSPVDTHKDLRLSPAAQCIRSLHYKESSVIHETLDDKMEAIKESDSSLYLDRAVRHEAAAYNDGSLHGEDRDHHMYNACSLMSRSFSHRPASLNLQSELSLHAPCVD